MRESFTRSASLLGRAGPQAPRLNQEPTLMPNSLALCFHNQRLRLVWVAGPAGDGLRLMAAEGAPFRYRPALLLYRWEEAGPALDERSAPNYLAARAAALEQQARDMDLEPLVPALTPEEDLPLERLGMLTRPALAAGPGLAALCMALLADGDRFRRGAGGFALRGGAERAQREEQARQAAAQAAWLAQVQAWCAELDHRAAADSGSGAAWSGAAHPASGEFLELLTSLLALEKRSPHWAALAKPLGLHALRGEEAGLLLKRRLVAAGAFPGWPAVWLRKAEVRRGFDPALVELAGALARRPPDPAGRTDFRAAPRPGPVYTLDAVDTFDYDDAYSILEADARGLVVAVHIAEMPAELAPGHPLFEAAVLRMSSVYTPGAIFPMFPPALGLGRCSLLKGEPREVVTLRFRLSDAGGALLGIERGLIAVSENLDYARAEDLLREQPQTWGRLEALAGALQARRVANGAVLSARQEVAINPSDPARVTLRRKERHGGVHRVIEELAIAYNEAIGSYCQKHGLPAFYRVQHRRKSTPEAPAPGQPVYLPPARYSLKGAPHAGLGCERYIHATSPLRRFPDLVMQRQVIEHVLTGRATFADRAQLEGWLGQAEVRQSAYDEAERRIDDHWARVYLSQNPALDLAAVVRRNDAAGARAWLEDVLLLASADLPPNLEPGDRFTARLDAVDLDRGTVRVRPKR